MSAAENAIPHYLIERLDELPTLPTIVYELSRVINDPMSSTSDVEKILSNDQSLTTKVLRLANSAYYAIPGGVSNLQRAIAYIGYDVIHQLVLSASIIQALDAKTSEFFDLNQFWKHSIGVAMAAEVTAKYLQFPTPADLFTCGLVHDMGKIAFYILDSEKFFDLIRVAEENNLSLDEAETEFGYTKHTGLGKELAQKWRLPFLIQASIAHHHHRNFSDRDSLSSEMNYMVDIVYLANLLINALEFGNSGHKKILGVPKDVVERVRLNPAKLKELIGNVRTAIQSADSFLKIIGG